jgi:hypothetical protein
MPYSSPVGSTANAAQAEKPDRSTHWRRVRLMPLPRGEKVRQRLGALFARKGRPPSVALLLIRLAESFASCWIRIGSRSDGKLQTTSRPARAGMVVTWEGHSLPTELLDLVRRSECGVAPWTKESALRDRDGLPYFWENTRGKQGYVVILANLTHKNSASNFVEHRPTHNRGLGLKSSSMNRNRALSIFERHPDLSG